MIIDQVVSYLERYAEHFELAPRFETTVTRAHRDDSGRWRVETDAGDRMRSANLVLATGYTRVPHVPSWPGVDDFAKAIAAR